MIGDGAQQKPDESGRRVVVGVDGSPGATRALDWAAREARARGVLLHVVVAESAPPGMPSPGHPVLDQALARCAQREFPQLVTGAVRQDSPATALLREAADAELLVVGRSGRGGQAGTHLGSVPASVLRYAPCDVAVVAGSPTGGPPHWTGDVLAGIDGSVHDRAVLDAAFAAARARSGRLMVVHAPGARAGRWDPPSDARALLDAAIAGGVPRYPDVEVAGRVVEDGPIHALDALSAGAALLVIGAVGRDSLPGQLLGSVPRALAGRIACPVLVVRDRVRAPNDGQGLGPGPEGLSGLGRGAR
ncbi:universal stress protein [Cryptosporangium minutisporangium]|uniref:Universal stress protein n=1 Tax=Cryptosporangium minutisporangium TaxID=113569 RepID=A0ABP6T8G1_9ACTN